MRYSFQAFAGNTFLHSVVLGIICKTYVCIRRGIGVYSISRGETDSYGIIYKRISWLITSPSPYVHDLSVNYVSGGHPLPSREGENWPGST